MRAFVRTCVQALATGEVDMLPAYWTPGGLYNRTYARVATFDPAPCPTFNTDYTPFINASECVCVREALGRALVKSRVECRCLVGPRLSWSLVSPCALTSAANAQYTTTAALVAAARAGTAKVCVCA